MTLRFGGLGVALITLFDGRGEVDAEATAQHASRLVDHGVRFVLVCGSTGEAWSLTPEERTRLIAGVRSALPPTVPVLAGTGADSPLIAGELTRQARDAGADAVLALSPAGSRDLGAYYGSVARAAGDLPALAYHFPTMSSPGIPVDVLSQLPIQGLKDSSGDAARLEAELTTWDGSVFVGSTSTIELARTRGGAGAILGIANAEPETCAAALEGDGSAQERLAALGPHAGRDFPLGIKELTSARFGTPTVMRGRAPSRA